MGTKLVDLYGLNPARVTTISNAAFYPSGAHKSSVSNELEPLRLGYFGSVSLEKGIVEYFDVLNALAGLGVAYRGFVAGPITAAVREQLTRLLSITSNVSYFGSVYREQKTQFLENLDVLLFPTNYVNEAEPLVILEAMRGGTYVIASKRGAISEMLANGGGLVCDRSSFVASAVDAIRAFDSDRALLGRAQQASVLQSVMLHERSGIELDRLLNRITGAPPASEQQRPAQLSRSIVMACILTAMVFGFSKNSFADVANRDTLEQAVQPQDNLPNPDADALSAFVGVQSTYDSNLFRLPASGVNISTLIGPQASREDIINTGTAGFDGNWNFGKQVVTLDLRVDDNRFVHNNNLNNVSSVDAARWNWILGDRFSGQFGADFSRALGGFYNTFVYTRDLIDQVETFGSARYALGPHVAVFGGVLFANTSLSDPDLKGNDNHRKAVDVGMEYAVGASSAFDFDYRYTDARYNRSSFLNGVEFDPDYRDSTARVTFKDAISDKTHLEALAGYLKREYPSTAIGAFSGYIWRVTLDWHPTEKTQLLVSGSRDLQADLSSSTDYFLSKAVSISPVWIPSEKINLALLLLRDQQDYIGTNEFVIGSSNRHDSVDAAQLNVAYSPFVFSQTRSLTLNLSYRREHRVSNQANLSFDDSIGKAAIAFKF